MATLFTRIIDDTGSGVSGATLSLRRRWSPQARVGAVTTGEDLLLTADTNGFISSPIIGGVFRVWIGGMRDPKLITVPDDDGSYLLEDLLGITGGTAALTYRYYQDCIQILNGTTGEFLGFRLRGEAAEMQLALDEGEDLTANYRWEGGSLQIWNADTEEWHAVWLSGASPQFTFGTAGELASGMARVSGGKLQLKNSTTSLWHSIYASGSTPTWVISAGAA